MKDFKIALTTEAYKAGYAQACEDIGEAIVRSRNEVFSAAKMITEEELDEDMERACAAYINLLNNREKSE